MTNKQRYFSPVLLAVAAAASIAAVPSALADPPSCTNVSGWLQHYVPDTGKCADQRPAAPVQYAPGFPSFGGNLIILHHYESHHGLGGHR